MGALPQAVMTFSLSDRTARQALAELNRNGNWFDWESLAPDEMAPSLRDRLTKVLRLMAGTTNLDEARSAYQKALRVLEDNGWGDHWGLA